MSEKDEKTRVVILDTSKIVDCADYGGMLYELKKANICEGKEFQIDNGYDLLMNYQTFITCQNILKKFIVKAVNL